MGFPLYVTCFSLAAFHILSLCLVFVNLISMYLGMFLLGFILYWTLYASWTWLTVSFSMLETFWNIISSNIFSHHFFFSSFSETHVIQMLLHLILSQRSLRLSSVLFILFTLSSEVISTILSFSSLIHSSASDILLLIPSREFLISVTVLFTSVCLFFNFSRSLLINFAFSSFYFQGFRSSLLLLFWILFQVVCLFPLHLFVLLCF